MGYGRADSKNGAVFKWNFPLLGTYWTAADIAVQHIAKEMGGNADLKGKKIALLYHDSPYGKEPIAALEALAKKFGFGLLLYPVTHPGIEQKSQWLSIRQSRPDYVILWGWGAMNGTAIKETAAVVYPREKMLGGWWSGAEPDVEAAGAQAAGFKALMLQHGAGEFAVHADVRKYVYAKGNGASEPDRIGQVLYNRGLVNAMLGVEAIRTAQAKFGDKPLSGEQVQWGLEHLNLSAARIKELGFEGMLRPITISCSDHEGARTTRVQQWDGKQWKVISDWYTADQSVIEPLVEQSSANFAKENGITPRDCGQAN
jgi:branched-chain amino acid transport system substrate-binding protein